MRRSGAGPSAYRLRDGESVKGRVLVRGKVQTAGMRPVVGLCDVIMT